MTEKIIMDGKEIEIDLLDPKEEEKLEQEMFMPNNNLEDTMEINLEDIHE